MWVLSPRWQDSFMKNKIITKSICHDLIELRLFVQISVITCSNLFSPKFTTNKSKKKNQKLIFQFSNFSPGNFWFDRFFRFDSKTSQKWKNWN